MNQRLLQLLDKKLIRDELHRRGLIETGTYIYRPVMNSGELAAWCRSHGVKNVMPLEEMHITIAYSHKNFVIDPLRDLVIVEPSAWQHCQPLGDKGAVVAIFKSPALSNRWQECLDHGATWDYPSYHPHVTLSYNSDVIPSVAPDFRLTLGPECHEALEEDWGDQFKKSVNGTKAVITQEATPALVRLAERLEPALRLRFITAIRQIQNTIELEQLAQAIASGNISRAETLLQLNTWAEKFGGLAIDLRAGFLAGTQIGTASLEQVGIQMSFRLIDPYTVEYARRRISPLVQLLKDGAREMVRQTITESVQGQWTPYEAAQGIKDWIGLTAQQASTAAKFERELRERGIAEEKITARLAKYENALLKQRAETIARTEIQSAANAGQLESWQEAVRQGLLKSDTKKRWLVAQDERLCPVCENLGSAEPVGLKEQFRYDDDTLAFTVFDEPLYAPPQHPNCRCTLVLEQE